MDPENGRLLPNISKENCYEISKIKNLEKIKNFKKNQQYYKKMFNNFWTKYGPTLYFFLNHELHIILKRKHL